MREPQHLCFPGENLSDNIFELLKYSSNTKCYVGFFIPTELVSCLETAIATFYMILHSKSHFTLLQDVGFINMMRSRETRLSIRSLHNSFASLLSALLFSYRTKQSKYWYILDESP